MSRPSADSPFVVALAGALFMAACMGIGRFAYTPLLPAMQQALGWSVAQAGDVASANFAGYLMGALLASTLVHRPSRWRWLWIGMILSAATTALGGLDHPAFAWWAVLRWMSGVASALCMVIGTAIVFEHLAQREASQGSAVHFAGVGCGIIGSVLVVEAVRWVTPSPFVSWAVLGAVSAALMLVASRMLRNAMGTDERAPERGQAPAHVPTVDRALDPALDPHGPAAGETSSTAALVRLIIAYGLLGFGYVITATFIVAMARTQPDASRFEPLIWIVVGASGAPSIWLWQKVAARVSVMTTLRWAYLLEAFGVLLAGFGSGPIALILGGMLLGGTFMAITAIGLAAVRELPGGAGARSIGWMTASFGLGQLLGPAVAGRLAHWQGGFQAPSALAAALLVLAAGLLVGIRLRR